MPRPGRPISSTASTSGWPRQPGGNGRVRQPEIVANPLSEGLAAAGRLGPRRAAEKLDEPEERQDFTAAANRLDGLAEGLEQWLAQQMAESRVLDRGRRRPRAASGSRWRPRPIDVGPILREQLFDKVPTVIMTSATLATAGPFDFFKSRVGLTQAADAVPGQPLRLPPAGAADPAGGHARARRRRARALRAGGDRR